MNRSPRSNIRRLAVGRLISVTGGAAAYTALNYWVWHRTHSPKMQALSLLLTFGVAGILGPLGGALGDRFDRRKVMAWSEAIAAAVFAWMVFVRDPGILIALAFVSEVAEAPFFSSSRAALPNLAEREEDIAWANSLITTGVHAGIAVGPVIGGLIVAVAGPSWVFGINALTFLISLGLTLSVRGRFKEQRTAEHDEHEGLGAGIRFLFGERVLRRIVLAWLVFALGMGMGMVADAPLAEAFRAGSFGFGLLIACWGTGSVLGTLAGRWMNARTEPIWMLLGAGGITLAALGVGFAPAFPLVLASLLVMGTCDGLTIVAENGILQRRTPDAVRSRTMAAFDAVLSFGMFFAFLLAAPVLRALGPQPVYRIGAVSAGLATIVLAPLRRLRRDSDDAGEAPPRLDAVGPAVGDEIGASRAESGARPR
jgi:MFS family permease